MNYYVSNLDFPKADTAEMWEFYYGWDLWTTMGKKVGGGWGVQGSQCRSALDEGDREDGR